MKKILTFLILSITISGFSQRLYKVTAKSGLSIRNKPSINGIKIGKLNLNETVKIIETTEFSFTYENTKGYWVKIETKDFQKGFVFNGFLKPLTNNRISYTLNRNEEEITYELLAEVNGKKYTIINFEDKECFDIVEIQDYNNNGFEEILLEQNACGGNGACNTLFAYSYDGNNFIKSDYIGYYCKGKKLNFDKHNNRIFILPNKDFKAEDSYCQDIIETYIYEKYNFKLIDRITPKTTNAIKELKTDDFFIPEKPETLSIKYDLDNNGIIDIISAYYWERWDILTDCEIILNDKVLESEIIGKPKRIGILKSKTKNVNDLVIDCNKILKWNGKNYTDN